MIASDNWWKIHTVTLHECYRDTMQILLYYGNMNMFQRKSLKLYCKKSTSKKEEIIRLHSASLRFLINTYERLSFQWSFFPRQHHATYRNMKSLILIYIFQESWYKFIAFFTNIYMSKQTIPVFYVKNTKFKPQATVQ